MTGGIFEANDPADLYRHVSRCLGEFCGHPCDYSLFNVLFSIVHLREWICTDDWNTYRNIPYELQTDAQKFSSMLHEFPDYKVLVALCNHAKHFNPRGDRPNQRIVNGARAGYARAGDSLDVRHYIVDGRELRDYLYSVWGKYKQYLGEL